jgi:anti-anti-sigma factor
MVRFRATARIAWYARTVIDLPWSVREAWPTATVRPQEGPRVIEANADWQPFGCDILPTGDAVRIACTGELDLAASDLLSARVSELLESGPAHVVLDLGGVTFLDSSGLRMILEARNRAAARAVRFTVEPGPPPVQRIFELTHTSELVFGEQD